MKTSQSGFKLNRPIELFYLVLALFVTTILTFFYPDFFYSKIMLFPSDLQRANSWYKLLTYPLAISGLAYWIYSAAIIILAGNILTNRISKKAIVTLVFLSTVLGGFVYSLLMQNGNFDIPLASPIMIVWGLSACTSTLILKTLNKSNNVERIFIGFLILSLFFIDYSNNAYLIAQLSVVLLGVAFSFFVDKTTHNTQVGKNAGRRKTFVSFSSSVLAFVPADETGNSKNFTGLMQ